MFSKLSNKELIDSYLNALKLKLDQEFICLLEEEIIRRGIELEG
ncbi:sporulation histidine kinase inhibitor Sda [Bacillus sp. MRMR6]|nr:sporulation histidine kinase inhibitor Sda [Bacillus sp. MRMR6]